LPDNIFRDYIDKGGIELTEQMRGLSELIFGVKKCIRDEKGESLEVQVCGKLNDFLKLALPKMAAVTHKYFPKTLEEKDREESSLLEDSAKKTDPNSSALSLQDPAIVPLLSSLTARVATYRDQLAAQLATDTKSLQHDLQSYIESSTGIEEDLYTLMMQNQNTKEKIAEERYKVEKAQRKLGLLATEKEKLEAELNEAQADLSSSEGLLLEESKEFREVLDKAAKVQLAIQSKQAQIDSTKSATNLERAKLEELAETQLRLEALYLDEQAILNSLAADNKSLSDRIEALRLARENLTREKLLQQEAADEFTKKLQETPLAASTPEKAIHMHFEGTVQHSPIAPPQDRNTNSPFTGAKESIKQMERGYGASPGDRPLPPSKSASFNQQLSAAHSQDDRPEPAPQEAFQPARFQADSVTQSNLLAWIGSLLIQAQSLKPAADKETLEAIERDILALDTSIKKMKGREEQVDFEFAKKRQQLVNLTQEESALKDNYIKNELKLELTQQKIIQTQAELARLNGMIEEAKRETDGKRKELMLKTESLARAERAKNAGAGASELRRADDELGMDSRMLELLPLKESGVKEPLLGEDRRAQPRPGEAASGRAAPTESMIIQLWLSSTVPLVVGYLLIRLGVL
jgi:chromosome segregation ATPase